MSIIADIMPIIFVPGIAGVEAKRLNYEKTLSIQ